MLYYFTFTHTNFISMAKVNFYLKNPQANKETLIYLFFSYNGNRTKLSTSEFIYPKHWNIESQRAKKSFTGYSEFNDYLDTMEESIKAIYRNAYSNGITLTSEYIKEQLNNRLNKKAGKQKSFFDYFDEFIAVTKPIKKENTIKKYTTLLNHLKNFQREKNFKLSFEKMDMKFYETFTAYCISDLKHLNISIGKNISNLKTFLHWATDRGYNTNTAFLKFKVKKEDADIIYLTENELMRLYKLDLGNNKRLESVRDVLCFGCFTGLRYSDISKLQRENVKGEEIHFTTQKTKDNLIVPLNDYAKDILKRYEYKLPIISNQKTNEYLKELGKLAGIDETIILTKQRGAEEVQFKEPKYNFISSHTARRTFVTLSLEKGMRPEVVMSITGHKDYKTFKKYIKLTSKVKLVEMKRIWNTPQLKAVS